MLPRIIALKSTAKDHILIYISLIILSKRTKIPFVHLVEDFGNFETHLIRNHEKYFDFKYSAHYLIEGYTKRDSHFDLRSEVYLKQVDRQTDSLLQQH